MTNRAPGNDVVHKIWDFVVVGGGAAGLVASRIAAGFGAQVLLIERDEQPGGDCLWTGCVPSKAFVAAARSFNTARKSPFVQHTGRVTVDFRAVMGHVNDAIAAIAPEDSVAALTRDGITVMRGEATFLDAHTVGVGDVRVRFRQAMIGTGARPRPLEVEGADTVDALTSASVWKLTTLPARLLVVGGGCMGCETGQAMARLGAHVTIVHRGEHLLPKETQKVSDVIRLALTGDGVDVRTGRTVERIIGATNGSGKAHLNDGSVVGFDRVLVALGRVPNTEGLHLERAGVALDEMGRVITDAHLRTSNPRIWAAGDVTQLPQYTHTGGVNGGLAAANAILGVRRSVDTDVQPRVTFTQPEVASVGLSATDGIKKNHRSTTLQHAHLDRAVAEGDVSGFTQIVTDARGRLLGATIVGPRAGESLGEMTVAIKNGLTATQIAEATHAYPTFSDGIFNACLQLRGERLTRGWQGIGVRALAGLQRVRLRRAK